MVHQHDNNTTGTVYPYVDPNAINAYSGVNRDIGAETGYVAPAWLGNTPEGQDWIQDLFESYNSQFQSGTAGYGLPGSAQGDPNQLYNSIAMSVADPTLDPALSSWIQQQGQRPVVPTWSREQNGLADTLARDLVAAQGVITKWVVTETGRINQELQQGLINAQVASAALQQAHELELQANDLAFKETQQAWVEKYGQGQLDILNDRLDWEIEFGKGQLADMGRRTDILQQGADLDTERFGLEKAIQEAMLKANPFNAVANALYMGGGETSGELDQFGAPVDTLSSSGTLPFLQDLSSGGIANRGFRSAPLNQQGIGGNVAPNPNSISQQSLMNMSGTEQGITSSLAAYQGYNPQDYWNQVQKSFNTAGQGSINFGTRLR